MTHHAYYIEGSLNRFDEYKAVVQPFWARSYERFGIDEARELIALAALKNYAEAVFFIGASMLTSEAQQALLKLFEEPQAGTTFVLLLPPGVLLATLRSRMLPYPTELDGVARVDEAKKFLKLGGKERSDYIAKILKDDEGVKDRVRDFIDGFEVVLAADVKKNREALEDIAMVRDYLRDRSPSLKMLLEHLALVV